MFAEVILWIYHRSPEIIATITGLLYIIYSIERNILLWPYGIVSSAIYIYVFYISGIYADMGLYVYYVVIGFYGWYHWYYGNKKTEGGNWLQVKKTGLKLGIRLLIFTFTCFFIILVVLKKYTDSTIPYWDSFTTALSITATWMLTQKYLEHWLLWIVVNSISIGLYYYKGLYPSVILFAVYTLLSITGYIEWKKELKKITAAD